MWAHGDECLWCPPYMNSPASSFSQDACVCDENTGWSSVIGGCLPCGYEMIGTYFANGSLSSIESCQCNAGFAGSDGSEFDEDYYQAGSCSPCPASTFKTEIRSVLNYYPHAIPSNRETCTYVQKRSVSARNA